VSPEPVAGLEELVVAVRAVAARRGTPRPYLIGIAGAVAVGKTTVADALATELDAAVVSTDGFLLPNAVLGPSAFTRKGFPDTYDEAALTAFLDALHAGGGQNTVEAPLYSHEHYDIDPVRRQRIVRPATVILEGVNALQPRVAERLHCRIYVDADEEHVEAWYVDRFLRLCDTAERDRGSGSFYDAFAAMPVDARIDVATSAWAAINLPNLHQHIAPTRARADIVVTKDADHRMTVTRQHPQLSA
jgi:type I pantothenate kinase